ncbi:hypothetical protein ACET3Z_031259 [Daucus carota]
MNEKAYWKKHGHERTCKDAHSSTDDLVGATVVQTPTLDTTAVLEDDDEHHDCILEMDVHEAPILTQGSQSTQGEGTLEWPEVVGTPPQTVWPAWPVVEFKTNVVGTDVVSAAFTKKGKYMVTHCALSQARATAKRKLGEANSDAAVKSDDTMHKDGHGDEAGGEDAT